MSTDLVVARPALPDLTPITRLVLDAVAPRTRPEYERALTDFLVWLHVEGRRFDKAATTAYVAALKEAGVPASSVNQRLAAIRRLALEAADNGLIDEQIAQAVKRTAGVKRLGTKAGHWLSAAEAQAMLDAPDTSSIVGVRDRAILAVLLGCGLRRSEVVDLTPAHLRQRDGRWVILDLLGKHGRTRTVPMAVWVKAAIDRWLALAPLADEKAAIFRRFNRNREALPKALNAAAIWQIVQKYNPTDEPLAPHDLRRTFAKLADEHGASIEQVQFSLGHESSATTERYVGRKQSIRHAPTDVIPLG